MNYIDRIASDLATECGDDDPTDTEKLLYRFYALLVLSRGADTTARDVHDAWAAWQTGLFSKHRSIVPFEELTPEVQALDDKYVDAIHAVAGRL